MKILLFIIPFLFTGVFAFCQDIIFKRNGDEIKAKVIEVTTTEVKYKKFTMPAGPTYSLLKSDIFMIKYPNGEKDLFEDAKKTQNTEESKTVNEGTANNSAPSEGSPNTQNTGGSGTQENVSNDQFQQFNQPSVNIKSTKFTVLHSNIQKINNTDKKDEILRLIKDLEDAVLRDDIRRAWQLQDEIDKIN